MDNEVKAALERLRVDVDALHSRLNVLEQRPLPAPTVAVDLSPFSERLGTLEQLLGVTPAG